MDTTTTKPTTGSNIPTDRYWRDAPIKLAASFLTEYRANMALLSDLVSISAQHRLDSEATLSLFSRRLREAERVSKAGRGRGAARMTFLDGARFLIACAATDHPERAADAEAVFSNLIQEGQTIFGENSFDNRSGDRTVLDVGVASVLSQIADGTLDAEAQAEALKRGHPVVIGPIISLDVFRGSAAATLRAGRNEWGYAHPAQLRITLEPGDVDDGSTILERADAWMRETERFRTGKNLHARLDGPLLRAVANAIAGNTPVIAERPTTITAPGAAAPGQIEEDQ